MVAVAHSNLRKGLDNLLFDADVVKLGDFGLELSLRNTE